MGKTKAAKAAPASVLLLDCNRNGLTARKNLLEQDGHAVTGCRNLDAAQEMIATEPVHLAIVASDADQATWIPALREAGFAGPLILVSGIAESAGLNAKNTGADSVIQKSAQEIGVLKREVQRLLRPKTLKKAPARATAKKAEPKSKQA